MNLSGADLSELADLAIAAAREAGDLIADSRPVDVQRKTSGASLASQVVTEIDRRSEDLILDRIGPTLERFELGLLTEEREDDRGRLTADFFWCIDPLDGTLPYIEGQPGYAVSIALVDRGGTSRLGVIYDPVEATVMHAIDGAGAFRNGHQWRREAHPAGEVLTVFADRSLLARDDHEIVVASLESVADELGLAGVELRPPRGGVMNACGVLEQQSACYFKFPGPSGGGSLWDFAATACLFGELGAVATDMRGDPLDLNRSDSTFMNHRGVLFASDEALAKRIRALRSASSGETIDSSPE